MAVAAEPIRGRSSRKIKRFFENIYELFVAEAAIPFHCAHVEDIPFLRAVDIPFFMRVKDIPFLHEQLSFLVDYVYRYGCVCSAFFRAKPELTQRQNADKDNMRMFIRGLRATFPFFL